MDIDRNVKMGADLAGNKDYKNIIEAVGLGEKLRKYPGELSGGEQQRASVARALAKRPKVLFLDEPTGNLDSKASRNVIELMQQMAETYNQTAVIVTHSEEIAKRATRIIRMEDGNILNTKASPFTVGHLTSI